MPGNASPATCTSLLASPVTASSCTIQNVAGALSARCGSLATIACPVPVRLGATTQLFEPVNPYRPNDARMRSCDCLHARVLA